MKTTVDGTFPPTSKPYLERRRAIVNSPNLVAKVLTLEGLSQSFTNEAYAPNLEVVFPVEGIHYVSDGLSETLVDLNQTTIIPRGLTTRDRHPASGDMTCLIVVPDEALLEEAWHHRESAFDPRGRGCFSTLSSPSIQYKAACIAAQGEGAGPLAQACLEEATLDIVRRVVGHLPKAPPALGARPSQLVKSVKELLSSSPDSLSLNEIASQVGATPTYLTDLFRRMEGIPIYRYQTRLRLARALRQLALTGDITGLALDLGFSSHSHFSSAFKSVYGVSPSQHRETVRRTWVGWQTQPALYEARPRWAA